MYSQPKYKFQKWNIFVQIIEEKKMKAKNLVDNYKAKSEAIDTFIVDRLEMLQFSQPDTWYSMCSAYLSDSTHQCFII